MKVGELNAILTVDNRGFGQHRDILNQMQGGDTRGQKLIQILHDVINPEENEDDDDYDDYDDDVDDYDDDDNGEETSDGNGTNGDIKGSSGSSNGYTDTSSYTNAADKMPKDDTASATSPYDLSLSLSIDDGDKPQEKLNIDNQTRKHDGGTVEKRDVNGGKMKVSQSDVNGETDRGDGVQLEAQQTVGKRSVGEEKRDLNGPDEDSWIPKQDIDKNQIPKTPNEEKCDVNSDGPQTPNEEKHDVNSDGSTAECR